MLDEADKMIDLNLEDSVNFIIDAIPEQIHKGDTEEIVRNQELEMSYGKEIYLILTHILACSLTIGHTDKFDCPIAWRIDPLIYVFIANRGTVFFAPQIIGLSTSPVYVVD